MNYPYTVTVNLTRSFEYSLYLTQNYITLTVDYLVISASPNTVEYRFKRRDHLSQFKARWDLY